MAWKLYNHGTRELNGSLSSRSPDATVSRLQLTGLHLVQYDGDQVRWQMNAAQASHQADDSIIVRHPDLTIRRAHDDEFSVAACDGRVEQATRAMSFMGAVHVSDERGNLLLTDQLSFDPERNMLHTQSHFVLEGSKVRLSGVGLQLNPDNRSMSVLKQVRMVVPKGWKNLV
ncbi:MAG: LPS export ABC transporter periplasmic protein LptC [Magnetococcales bacterium]|nr:LPS export ABC transporter periplasmic protein LptC [Magnetococcales bacterium]